MNKLTKWGLFIGTEEECKAFEAEMTRREQPKKEVIKEEVAPAKATPPKTPAKRKTTK
jgi:hypothetical protein